MFSYSFALAVEMKIIDEKIFKPVVESAYNGIVKHSLAKVDEKYLPPSNVCVGTCIGNKDYYFNRKKEEGTSFGIGVFIMFGLEYQKLKYTK